MSDFTLVALDESTPLTEEQMCKMVRDVKIHKLADMLRQIKYPVFPNGAAWADLGVQFGSHVYRYIAEQLIDNGVEVDVVHCGKCKHLDKKIEYGGFCKCGEVVGSYPRTKVSWGYCDHGERETDDKETVC